MYQEYPPPAHLRPDLRCLWRGTDGPKWIVPDGCLDLIVAGERVFVAGPDTTAWRSTVPEGTVLHGARFRPGHAPTVLAVAANELTDQRVDLTELWGRAGREVTEQLVTAPTSLPEVIAARPARAGDPLLDVVLARLDAGASRVGVTVTDLGISERQLRRRFTEAVGYGPATYLKVARLRRAFRHAAQAPDLAALAGVAGYADQAHLSRDCRALAGTTPAILFAADNRSVHAEAA